PRPKSTTPDPPDRAPLPAESIPPTPAVQPFPLTRNDCRFLIGFVRGTISHSVSYWPASRRSLNFTRFAHRIQKYYTPVPPYVLTQPRAHSYTDRADSSRRSVRSPRAKTFSGRSFFSFSQTRSERAARPEIDHFPRRTFPGWHRLHNRSRYPCRMARASRCLA